MTKWLFGCLSALWLLSSPALILAESANRYVSTSAAVALIRIEPAAAPPFTDDAPLNNLKSAVQNSMLYYGAIASSTLFYFGRDTYTAVQMLESMRMLGEFLERGPDPSDLNLFVREKFRVYASANNTIFSASAPIIFSAYYEHTLTASLTPDKKYRYPVYARPPDLVDVPLNDFDPSRRGERIAGRVKDGKLAPYFTREEIDSGKALSGQNLEIAWSRDPLDIYFLQVQGSGWIQLAGSTQTLHIRYAGDNGRPYRSIGKYLMDSGQMLAENFSRDKMVRHLRSLDENMMRKVLNQNPRYIFFEIVSSTNLTRGSLSVPITAGRSIASDPKLYPPGALAWIQTSMPDRAAGGEVSLKKELFRFALNQDEGGAIKGPGRIDFFLGGGKDAEEISQKLWYPGDLYFFARK